MKSHFIVLIAIAAALTLSCNEKKSAVNDATETTKERIDKEKAEVDAAAKEAIERTEAKAAVDKATIEANTGIIQAQLDAEKKLADAAAKEAKAKIDAETEGENE